MEFSSSEIVAIAIGSCVVLWILYKARRFLADILGAIAEAFD